MGDHHEPHEQECAHLSKRPKCVSRCSYRLQNGKNSKIASLEICFNNNALKYRDTKDDESIVQEINNDDIINVENL